MNNNFCSKCGNKLEDDAKFCHNCGEKLVTKDKENSNQVTKYDRQEEYTSLECPYCKSHNINTQIITENKNCGCLMIFLYLILALTVVGLPIMIFIILAKGKKTASKTIYICQNCGKTFKKSNNIKTKNDKKSVIICSIVIPIAILCFILSAFPENSNKYISKSEYTELDPQILYNDYNNNELAADDKYKGNYYYITGEITGIEHFLTDNYLNIRFNSTTDKTKVIEITAYFNDVDELKEVKKGDIATVYGKFHQRSIENYYNVTVFSLKDCHLNMDN